MSDVMNVAYVRTSCNDVEDAWVPLFAHVVPGPAHECSVLQGPRRGEGQDGARVVGVDEALLHLFGLCRVVEGPSDKRRRRTKNGKN